MILKTIITSGISADENIKMPLNSICIKEEVSNYFTDQK